ncbi:TetR/AcrR family transcriptional regulator [Streptosporangium sp. NPDC000396]|uniref:TetR/AcrR family transcriptional regulator n=1 Tax=Streptosporangium sp. NPDC000396 TaxID=3366185 RepID=UPI003687F931
MNGPATPSGGTNRGTAPATPKGSARRAAVLDAAEQVLAESGHAALSLRAVADAVGIRLGNLQYYFPTRADLIGALLDRVLKRSLEKIESLAGPAGERTSPAPSEVIRALLAEHADRRLVRLFVEVWALAAADEAVAEAVRGFYRAYAELVAGMIGQARPELPEQTRRARAEAFVALMEGASLLRSGIAGGPSTALDAELKRLARTLLDGD